MIHFLCAYGGLSLWLPVSRRGARSISAPASPPCWDAGRDQECDSPAEGPASHTFWGHRAPVLASEMPAWETSGNKEKGLFSCYLPSDLGQGGLFSLEKVSVPRLALQRVPGPLFLVSLCVPGSKTTAVFIQPLEKDI